MSFIGNVQVEGPLLGSPAVLFLSAVKTHYHAHWPIAYLLLSDYELPVSRDHVDPLYSLVLHEKRKYPLNEGNADEGETERGDAETFILTHVHKAHAHSFFGLQKLTPKLYNKGGREKAQC